MTNFKNRHPEYAFHHLPDYFHPILREMLSTPTHLQRTYVDFKQGTPTGTGHWHLDSSLNPGPEYENQLWVSAHGTEFCNVPPPTDITFESSKDVDVWVKERLGWTKYDSFQIPIKTIHHYTGYDYHRTPPGAGERTLLRVIYTNQELPHD